MATYPRNLSYVAKKLAGFSKQNFRLMTLNQTSATPSQIITVDLPSNSLCDLQSLTMYFKGTTTTTDGAACFSRGIESIIERLEIEVNGQLLQGSCANYQQLWQAISDTTMGEDAHGRRKILQNGQGLTAVAQIANVTTQQFAIHNFLGFIASAQPSVIDSALLGTVRLRITLSPATVLTTNATAANASYSLSDIFFSIDTLSIDDGIFHQMYQKALASGNILEIPYTNYTSFSSVSPGLNQTTKASISTKSLDRIWAFFVTGDAKKLGGPNAAGSRLDLNTGASSYFTRIGNGAIPYGDAGNFTTVTSAITGYQINVNGQFYPNWRPSGDQAFGQLVNSLNVAADTLGGMYPGMDSLFKFGSSYWLASHEFAHGESGYESGLDTRGNIAQIFFQTDGAQATAVTGTGGGAAVPTQYTCLLFTQSTASLRIASGRQLEVVL